MEPCDAVARFQYCVLYYISCWRHCDEKRQDSSNDRMIIAEPLNTSQKHSKTTHVPISGFEELNTVRLATGISTSDLSGNDPLFPQNYTAWTTPTQLIKKTPLRYRLPPTAMSTVLRITRGNAQHIMDLGDHLKDTIRGVIRQSVILTLFTNHELLETSMSRNDVPLLSRSLLPPKLARNSSGDGFKFTTTVDCKVCYNQAQYDCRQRRNCFNNSFVGYSKWRPTCECILLQHKTSRPFSQE